jgi:hypothetical protein
MNVDCTLSPDEEIKNTFRKVVLWEKKNLDLDNVISANNFILRHNYKHLDYSSLQMERLEVAYVSATIRKIPSINLLSKSFQQYTPHI